MYARALCQYVPVMILAYVTNNDPAQVTILDELARIGSLEVIYGRKLSMPAGTWRTYQYLPALLRRRPEIRQVLFLDAALSILAPSLLFRPLPGRCPVTAIQVWGPEAEQVGNRLKVGLKRLIYPLATQYRPLKLILRSPELTASWRQSGLVAPEACLELPTLERIVDQVPPGKLPLADRDDLIFSLLGHLRPQKNIARLIPLFRDGMAPGRLHLAGPLPPYGAGANLPELVAGAGERIIFRPEYLPELELDKIGASAHYNLMLYVDWDDRMESGMVFTSARQGTPIIGRRTGWIGRMITEYELGYAIDPYNVDEIRACLNNCALPGSAEYRRFEAGIQRLVANYRPEVVVPKFLAGLGLDTSLREG
jgi:glycosyltransferase involved in cell wall biosynthesis